MSSPWKILRSPPCQSCGVTWVVSGLTWWRVGISNQSVVKNGICRMRIVSVIAGWWFQIFGED